MPIFLRESEIAELLPIEAAISVVEEAFHAHGQGIAQNLPRQRAKAKAGQLHVNVAAINTMGIGLKAATVGTRGIRFVVLLWDVDSGDLKAVIEAVRLGQIRTGAASAVASKYMAREDSSTLGLFGSGKQAWSQISAICAVRDIRQAWVYSPTRQNREQFAGRMTEALGIPVTAVSTPKEVVVEADIIATITRSETPLFPLEWLKPGVHINAAGSNRAQACEIGPDVIQRAGAVAIDDCVQGEIEAGDLINAVNKGAISWAEVVELGQIVAGVRNGRDSNQDITIFKSLGVGIEDIAVANRVYELALKRGIGTAMPATMLG